MKIKFATMTGPNDATSVNELLEISDEFPFVEWGVLVSESQTGATRFPTTDWIHKFCEHEARRSLHLCGRWLRDLCNGGWTVPDNYNVHRFQRMQLNFHGYLHIIKPAFFSVLKDELRPRQFILQLDGVNDSVLKECLRHGIDACPIFDQSHGAGVLPKTWPSPITDVLCTYAGGLGPDNIEAQLQAIEWVVGDAEICVDMETKIRSNNDATFDLDKVRFCLKEIAHYVPKSFRQ